MSGPATVNDSVEEGTEDDFVGGWSGNKRRNLWKTTCSACSAECTYTSQWRYFISQLMSIHVNSAIPLRARPSPLCISWPRLRQPPSSSNPHVETWEDHLWAQISIICEGKQVNELTRACGGRWLLEGRHRHPRSYWGGVACSERTRAGEGRERMGTRSRQHSRVSGDDRRDRRASVARIRSIFRNCTLYWAALDKLLTDFASGLQNGDFNPEQSKCVNIQLLKVLN